MNSIKLLFSCLAIGLLMSSCKPEPKDEVVDTALPVAGTTTTTTAQAEKVGGSYAAPVIPDQNNPSVQLLQRTYWVAEFWVNHENNDDNKPNKCRWWLFKPDGTFTFGQWQETFSYGSWVLYADDGKEILHIDAADDRYDMEFEMQAISQLQDYMSWTGTKTYGMSRIAVKATSLLTMPTKAQFGVAE